MAALDLQSVSLTGTDKDNQQVVSLNLNKEEEIQFFLINGGDACFAEYMEYAEWNGTGHFASCMGDGVVYLNF